MLRVSMLTVLALTAACKTSPLGSSTTEISHARALLDEAPATPEEPPAACATALESEEADVLRVAGANAYYVRGDVGLSIFDVSDPASPRRVGGDSFAGFPLGVFVVDRLAVEVFADSDASSARTVIRALDVASPERPRPIGQQTLPWIAHDVRRVGRVLYILGAEGDEAVLDSFSIGDGDVRHVARTRIKGARASIAVARTGIVVLHPRPGEDVTRLTWIDRDEHGNLATRGSVDLPGSFPVWEQPARRLADVDDGGRALLVVCGRAGCPEKESAYLVGVDFSDPERPRPLAATPLGATSGVPVARFVNGALVFTRPSAAGTELVAMRMNDRGTARETGRAILPGEVAAIVPRTLDHALVLGRSARVARSRIAVHDVRVDDDGSVRLGGSVTFGTDWTWTPAYDDDRAIAFDATRQLVATPFTKFDEAERRYGTGAQFFDLSGLRPTLGRTAETSAWIDRTVFVGGKLLAFGADGVHVIETTRSE